MKLTFKRLIRLFEIVSSIVMLTIWGYYTIIGRPLDYRHIVDMFIIFLTLHGVLTHHYIKYLEEKIKEGERSM